MAARPCRTAWRKLWSEGCFDVMPDLRDDLQTSLGQAYTLEREIGGGGMSRVYLAEDTALHRRIVVKVLSPELAGDVSLARFEREITLAAACSTHTSSRCSHAAKRRGFRTTRCRSSRASRCASD